MFPGNEEKALLLIYKKGDRKRDLRNGVEFKSTYLHGVCDAGSRLLFKFRSGMHDLNKKLGRHRKEGR